MRLWDDEIEALRPAITAEAMELVATANFGSKGGDGDPASRDYEADRTRLRSTEVLSDLALDRNISGPAGDLRLRVFGTPVPARAVMLHLHGGGWAVGRPEINDPVNEMLAKERGIAVVSVDYRLAPEHRFPAAIDDCEAAATWLLDHATAEFGTDTLLIGGESAGAHLAVLTLLRLRDAHDAVLRVAGANIAYGYFDFAHLPSHTGVNAGPDIVDYLGLEAMAKLVLPGLSTEERRSPQWSPLWADLHGLPPALFTVGLDDRLADDNILMASRWARAGNEAELLVYPGAPHGCTALLPTVREHFTSRLYGFFDRCLAGR